MNFEIGSTKEEVFEAILGSGRIYISKFAPEEPYPRARDIEFRKIYRGDFLYFSGKDKWVLSFKGNFSVIGFGYTISLRFGDNKLKEIVWIRQFGL